MQSLLSLFDMAEEDEVLDRELHFELGKRFESVLGTLLIQLKSFFEEGRVGDFRIKACNFDKDQEQLIIECSYPDELAELSAPSLLQYGGYEVTRAANVWTFSIDVEGFEQIYDRSKVFLPAFYAASAEMIERMRARTAGELSTPGEDTESQRAQGIVSLFDQYAEAPEDKKFLSEMRIRLRLMAFLSALFEDRLNYKEEDADLNIKYLGANKVLIAFKQECLVELAADFLHDFIDKDKVQVSRFPMKNLMVLTVDTEVFDRFSRPA
ncbi:hypothetical protein HY605_05880 [Candidatus Peregrinibacteria bacterium]|nr:hypothetical protein [Candidatus Peregrinibacteria bacterium]